MNKQMDKPMPRRHQTADDTMIWVWGFVLFFAVITLLSLGRWACTGVHPFDQADAYEKEQGRQRFNEEVQRENKRRMREYQGR